MEYALIIIVLFVTEVIYLRIADKYNIVDKPNERSSHTQVTIRGGGIIYWIAAALYTLLNPSHLSFWFFIGITLMATISFIDDIVGMGRKIRILSHLLAITCAFILTNAFNTYPWWSFFILYFICIGIINMYNFMDGINGITGLYTIAVLLPMMYINYYVDTFVEHDFLRYPFLASLVFLFFNFRKKAKCFAGDVGSVSISFWVVTLLLILVVKTGNFVWFGFLMVYGVDSVCTILHRVYLKQNITEAHRLHFYQILANEQKMPHRLVSVIYFLLQLICSALIIALYPIIGWWIFAIILIVLIAIYPLKFKLMKNPKMAIV